MKITVFTPTYNRAYIIEKLYHSLQRQTFKDFEWIVVDDGSEDETEDLFKKIQKDKNLFEIRYIKQKNGGKHRAINKGIEIAKGELFFIVDSDDYLIDTALKTITEIEESIPENEKKQFAGVCGLRGYSEKKENGKTFCGDILDITSLEREKYGIYGDKAEVFYTSILKKYPFPTFENEKFITECVVWDKIAFDKYKIRYFNKIIYISDYLPDGLTAHVKDLYKKNPKGYGLYLAQCAKYGKIRGVNKWTQYMQYFYDHRKELKFKEIAKNLQMNSLVFYIRLWGIRAFYKLYDK